MLIAKLAFVSVILAFAAYNKLVLTPRMTTSPNEAKQGLRASIRYELVLAVCVLLLTGVLSTTSPNLEH